MSTSEQKKSDDLLQNKIFGGLLGTWLLILVLNYIVQPSLYQPHHLAEDERGYIIEVPEDTGHSDKPKELTLAQLLANADVSKGERQTAKCISCHTFEDGGGHGTGPNLWNVLTRGRAATDFANYSTTLTSMGGQWDFQSLFNYLIAPSEVVSGTNMSFAGFGRKRQDAANVVAYLNTLSANPQALPEPEPEPAAAGAGEDAVAAEAAEGDVAAPEAASAPAAGAPSAGAPEVPTPEAVAPQH